MSKILINKVVTFFILIVVLGITLAIVENNQKSKSVDISVDGTIICLPHKDSSPTEECTLGLRSFNAEQYSLQFTNDPSDISFDDVYRVSGTFISDKNNTSRYVELGTITVNTFEVLTN